MRATVELLKFIAVSKCGMPLQTITVPCKFFERTVTEILVNFS